MYEVADVYDVSARECDAVQGHVAVDCAVQDADAFVGFCKAREDGSCHVVRCDVCDDELIVCVSVDDAHGGADEVFYFVFGILYDEKDGGGWCVLAPFVLPQFFCEAVDAE